MRDIVILGSARTPIGAFLGSFKGLAAHELGAIALAAAVERSKVPGEAVEQVNFGSVLTAGQGQAPVRRAVLGAGLPVSTGAVTIGKVCGSGMRALMFAANDLRCGDYKVVAAGGMESMSQAPFLLPKVRDGLRLGHAQLIDSVIMDGLWDPHADLHMGSCAEMCARKYSFTRERQDELALESYRRAREATEEGFFDAEITPVEVSRKREVISVERDEDPFRVDLAKAPSLRPVFEEDGTVTAANASNLNDGAAALVLTTSEVAEAEGLVPKARIVAQSSVAQEPEWFTTAPVEAVKRVLERAQLSVGDIDLWEINEAFSVVVLACLEELEIDHLRVNVNGGAIALGHPIGCSGARILVTLLHALERLDKRIGCATICIGGGEAAAVVVERL